MWQGQIQDLKLGVAQWIGKFWKPEGGYCIDTFKIRLHYYSLYLKYDILQIRFLVQYLYLKPPYLYNIVIKKAHLEKNYGGARAPL